MWEPTYWKLGEIILQIFETLLGSLKYDKKKTKKNLGWVAKPILIPRPNVCKKN